MIRTVRNSMADYLNTAPRAARLWATRRELPCDLNKIMNSAQLLDIYSVVDGVLRATEGVGRLALPDLELGVDSF